MLLAKGNRESCRLRGQGALLVNGERCVLPVKGDMGCCWLKGAVVLLAKWSRGCCRSKGTGGVADSRGQMDFTD